MAWKVWSQFDLLQARNGETVSRGSKNDIDASDEHYNTVMAILGIDADKLPVFGDYNNPSPTRGKKKERQDGVWFEYEFFLKRMLENLKVYISEEAYQSASNNGKDNALPNLWKKKGEPKNQTDLALKISTGKRLDTYIGGSLTSSQKKEHKDSKAFFVWEHVVPTSCFVEHLKNLDNLTQDNLNALIEKYGNVCIVTKREDSLLNENLKDKMPDGWDWGEKDDPWARYIEKGIEVKGVPSTQKQ